MKTRAFIALSIALFATAGIATSASAHDKTRAEVRQELIQAENNGLGFVTDTSYPAVNPIFEQQVARLQSQTDSSSGAPMGGSSAAGNAAVSAIGSSAAPSACVGPLGFCSPYFGS
ncbi:DUF4148 domain-containing protein [Paraburkholderia terrae]|uniref:DUF4148 domain-containing protein n=1 Tax=Paraburkholderia terrae TaxID=311230 RepID=UPI00296AA572|nr:DUF4148 domain-containing protein [Paraburkholderia terrae]MDW3663535.1 DUF4148 domain-containing protein [Paraburkholderia terrae]